MSTLNRITRLRSAIRQPLESFVKPNSRQLQKEKTRREILDAARTLFLSHGYDSVTTRQIAREAGVGTGTVFAHFADKHRLVRALLLQDIDDILHDAQRGLDDRAGAVDALMHYAEGLYAYYWGQRELSRALLKDLMFNVDDYESQSSMFIAELTSRLEVDAPQLSQGDRSVLAGCLMANYFMVLIDGLGMPESTLESWLVRLEESCRLQVRPYGETR